MPTIYFAGGEDLDWRWPLTVWFTTDSSYFRSSYARAATACSGQGFSRTFSPITSGWLSFREYNSYSGNPDVPAMAGLGKSGRFPSFINDHRVVFFDEESEKKLCSIYAESLLIIGIHGSGMLLPSAHSGMTICLMPSKRWGNFEEDIVLNENDARLSLFQKRIVPLNMCILDICDMAVDMIKGRNYFIRKFIHDDEL